MFGIDEDLLKIVDKKKSKRKKKADLGIGSSHYISTKTRIAEWVNKVWEYLDKDIPVTFRDGRLCKEFAVDKITPYVRNELSKRGVKLKKMTQKVGSNKYVYWGATKIEDSIS